MFTIPNNMFIIPNNILHISLTQIMTLTI